MKFNHYLFYLFTLLLLFDLAYNQASQASAPTITNNLIDGQPSQGVQPIVVHPQQIINLSTNGEPKIDINPSVVQPVIVQPIITDPVAQNSNLQKPQQTQIISDTSSSKREQQNKQSPSSPTQNMNLNTNIPQVQNPHTNNDQKPVESVDQVNTVNPSEKILQNSDQNVQSSYQRNSALGQHSDINNYQPRQNVTQPSSQANYDDPDPERSARYQAQQQQMRIIRMKQQAQTNRRQAEERQIRQRAFDIRTRQKKQLNELLSANPYGPMKSNFFEIERSIVQFYLNPAQNIEIIIHLSIYVLQNNVYGVLKDVDKDKPLTFYIYEDNARIIAHSELYFEKGIKFEGKAKSNYLIRFYNEGIHKLISMRYTNMVEASHLAHLYSQQKKELHMQKTAVLTNKISQILLKLRQNSFMDTQNSEVLIKNMRKYSFYQILEMFLLIIITAFQVKLIKNMFKNDSIL